MQIKQMIVNFKAFAINYLENVCSMIDKNEALPVIVGQFRAPALQIHTNQLDNKNLVEVLIQEITKQGLLLGRDNPVYKKNLINEILASAPDLDLTHSHYFEMYFGPIIEIQMKAAQIKLRDATLLYHQHYKDIIRNEISFNKAFKHNPMIKSSHSDDLILEEDESLKGGEYYYTLEELIWLIEGDLSYLEDKRLKMAEQKARSSAMGATLIEYNDHIISHLSPELFQARIIENKALVLAIKKYEVTLQLLKIIQKPIEGKENPIYQFEAKFKSYEELLNTNRKLAAACMPEPADNFFIKNIKSILYAAGRLTLFFRHLVNPTASQRVAQELREVHKNTLGNEATQITGRQLGPIVKR